MLWAKVVRQRYQCTNLGTFTYTHIYTLISINQSTYPSTYTHAHKSCSILWNPVTDIVHILMLPANDPKFLQSSVPSVFLKYGILPYLNFKYDQKPHLELISDYPTPNTQALLSLMWKNPISSIRYRSLYSWSTFKVAKLQH